MRRLDKRPSNLIDSEFSALRSSHVLRNIAIKPADKGGALVVWMADLLYRDEALRQLSDTAFYTRVDKDLTSTHLTTIHTSIANGNIPDSAKNLISSTPVVYSQNPQSLTTQVDQ